MTQDAPRWTSLPRWAVRAAVWLAVLAAALAWVLSYSSQAVLAAGHGYPAWQAALWPLTTDLVSLALMIVALDAADTKRRGATVRAVLLTILSAGVMIGGNVLIAWPDPIAVAMHSWPPFISAALWFVLAHDRPRTPGRVQPWPPNSTPPEPNRRTEPNRTAESVHGSLSGSPARLALPAARVSEAAWRDALRELGPGASNEQLAERLGCAADSIRRYRRRWPDANRPHVVDAQA